MVWPLPKEKVKLARVEVQCSLSFQCCFNLGFLDQIRVLVHGAFKLDHLQTVEPLLF